MLCNNKVLVIFFLFFLLIFNIPIQANSNIIDLNLKGVDLRDALRTIAELAKVNLIADKSVSGQITMNLEGLSFEDSLKLITESNGLDWKFKDNTFFVADKNRINELFEKYEVNKVKIKHRDCLKLKDILAEIYPDINFTIDKNQNILLFRSKSDIKKEIFNIISLIDRKIEENTEKKSFSIIEVDIDYLNDIKESIKLLFSNVKVIPLKASREILIYGKDTEVKSVESLIKNNFSEKREDEICEKRIIITKKTFEEILDFIKNKNYKISIIYEENTNELYLKGEKDIVDIIISIAKKLNTFNIKEKVVKKQKVNYINENIITNLTNSIYSNLDIYFDYRQSILVVKGEKSEVNNYLNFLENIDNPRPQVMIEAQILELSTRSLKEIGVEAGELSKITILSEDNSSLDFSWPDLIKYIKDRAETKVLASPSLLTIAGEKAEMLIGDKIPMKLTTDESEEIKYIEAGINLSFLPILTEKKEIILELNPKVSSIGETLVNGLPAINTREINTKVRLNDREVFVIAGLIKEDLIKSKSKIPYLADIPVLGKIFSSYNENKRENEIVILIKPYIIDYRDKSNNYEVEEGKQRVNIEEYNVWKNKMKRLK
ncbi:MAG: type II secretion system protein GspD [Bacillota bacterium]